MCVIYIILIQPLFVLLIFCLLIPWQDENSKALWIHHWIILQLVHPYFRPRKGYDFREPYVPLKDNGLNFIHEKYLDFIMTTNDGEFKDQYKKILGCPPPKNLAYGIVWKGAKIN